MRPNRSPPSRRAAALDALRVAYRRLLLVIAGHDLAAPDPAAAEPAVSAALADLAAGALEAALAIARSELPAGSAPCRIAVLGMGKCGGRELNYVSDVDVIYVVEPVAGSADGDEQAALATGAKLAAGLARACSEATAEGTLWPVDAALRPEGKRGPLVRTLESHLAYYRRWAATWEFQALLKARPVAGDVRLGQAWLDAIHPLVWRAAERPNFVEDVQAMRRRVEEHVPAEGGGPPAQARPGRPARRRVQRAAAPARARPGRPEAAHRQHAGGAGGARHLRLRRARRRRRARPGLPLPARARAPDPALPAAAHPRRARRPGRPAPARARPRPRPGTRRASWRTQWHRHALEVRRLHEKLFYRPLLAAAARLSTDEVRLTPEAARARLAALGYRDPAGALRHLEALTGGVSRRAAIQRQLLPVLLGWFADGPDPDAGLLAFRRLSEELGTTHWYLKMLRDSGAAAERMAHVLSSSRYVADLLAKGPEAVALLGDDDELEPRPREVTPRGGGQGAGAARGETRGGRASRRSPCAGASSCGRRSPTWPGCSSRRPSGPRCPTPPRPRSTAGCARRRTPSQLRLGRPLPTRMLVVAMGRLGGGELGYGSDADVLFVHDPLPGEPARAAEEAAAAVAGELRRLLSSPGPEPPLAVDADLRPEGRNGPLVRTLASYAEYYARWSLAWEAQALTRAVPVAGDADLGRRFEALIDPLRWPARGLGEGDVREVRRIKARVEAERLPRGADPHRHLKLGPRRPLGRRVDGAAAAAAARR